MNKQQEKVRIITIDGPSGTGKGTISKLLAKTLNWHYLDSGAIYRALAYDAEQKKIDNDDVDSLIKLAKTLDLKFQFTQAGDEQVMLNHQDVTKLIRQEDCGKKASYISSKPGVRAALLQRQRDFAAYPGLVTDGRDMGTVVFPEADLKLFLEANKEERARRRYLQLKDLKNDVSLAQVVDELVKRDERDTKREHSPLKPAENAVIIDTTTLNVTQLLNTVLKLIKERFEFEHN